MKSTELTIRPSTKLILAKYVVAILLALALTVAFWSQEQKYWMAAYAIPLWMIVTGVATHAQRRFTTLKMAGERLQYESGMASKTARSIPLHKVQDVAVRQSMVERMLGIGTLTIETAGDAGRLTMEQIDSPRVVAETILDRVTALNSNKK